MILYFICVKSTFLSFKDFPCSKCITDGFPITSKMSVFMEWWNLYEDGRGFFVIISVYWPLKNCLCAVFAPVIFLLIFYTKVSPCLPHWSSCYWTAMLWPDSSVTKKVKENSVSSASHQSSKHQDNWRLYTVCQHMCVNLICKTWHK